MLQVLEALLKFCDIFGGAIRDGCRAYMTDYTAAIIHLLVNYYLDPLDVCKDLGFCKQQQK